MPNSIEIQDALTEIKTSLEKAIKEGGEAEKTALIRSQKLIKRIHETVKSEFIKAGVNPENIKPKLGVSEGELKLAGFFKKKDQDICIVPNNLHEKEEFSDSGLLLGEKDRYGKEYTEHIISVNIRSQLSSLAKNFDTLYERTFAESLNLHMRCPKMCLGEVYMIPVCEYDTHAAQEKKIAFADRISSIEKYLLAFDMINLRRSVKDDLYKYERVCLLIVDFRTKNPKIYHNDKDLKKDGLLPHNSRATISRLNFRTFAKDLLKVYSGRFGTDRFR